ncbi:MAG: hypothetical protein H7099_03485 [Gemmatimonadaceae bacterium]|nr:hypothetical protein [Gemmatimonadaceae bacterium]
MTRTHTLTLASALMAVALVSASPAAAQGATPPDTGKRVGPPPGGMGRRGPMFAMRRNAPSVDERVQRLSGELNLTAEQAARVKAVLIAEQRSADSIRAVRAVQREAEHKAMQARHDANEKALLAILTPEQKTKREALMKQHRGPDGRARGHGGPMGRPGDRRGPGDDDSATR